MRHNKYGFKLGRDSEHRQAMFRNMAISLFTHGQITTTVHKAKAVQPYVERLITWAKKGDLSSRRRIHKKLGNPIMVDFEFDWYDVPSREEGWVVDRKKEKIIKGPRVVAKLVEEIAPQYVDRAGGYTRIIRLGKHRIGDGADLVVLQLVGDESGPNVKGRSSRRRQKQDRRTAFAAKLRKGEAPAEEEAVVEEEAVATAVAEAPVEEATTEAPVEEAASTEAEAPEATEEKKED